MHKALCLQEMLLDSGLIHGQVNNPREEFPKLYLLSTQKNVLISRVANSNNHGDWNFIQPYYQTLYGQYVTFNH